MNTLWPLLRAWVDRCSLRRRRALAKRRLESVCRQAGCSRSQSALIVAEFFR